MQWMVTGQSGQSGKSVLVPVARATGPGCAPAPTPPCSMVADPVRARQWRPSCVASGPALVSTGHGKHSTPVHSTHWINNHRMIESIELESIESDIIKDYDWSSTDHIDYLIPVAGNWGAWLPWSSCSETCGKGMQTRVRLCNNPPSSFHGPPCEGPDTQTQLCKERHCPGKWFGN